MREKVLSVLILAAPLFPQTATQEAAGTPGDSSSFAQEAVLNAPVASVWKVWSTSEGYKQTGVAQAEVDLRVGGLIRSRYSAKGVLGDEETIENRILAYEPLRMIAFRIDRPPKSFPFKEAWKTTWFVVTLTDLGDGRTHIRAASMGFGTDEESMKMRKFFEDGNALTLGVLQRNFDSATSAREKR
jgi:uncharacterized protein YndB with AHSA1/START domain